MGHQHIVSGKWLIPVLLAFIGFAVLGSPQSVASDKDAEIRDTILRQIEAFANNDEEQAWAHASEGIKRRFGSSQVFVDMVREAYPAVHNATAIEFTQRVPTAPLKSRWCGCRGRRASDGTPITGWCSLKGSGRWPA